MIRDLQGTRREVLRQARQRVHIGDGGGHGDREKTFAALADGGVTAMLHGICPD
jgi:hypothetical protein